MQGEPYQKVLAYAAAKRTTTPLHYVAVLAGAAVAEVIRLGEENARLRTRLASRADAAPRTEGSDAGAV